MQTAWLASVDPKRFDEFLSASWKAMREVDAFLPEAPAAGIGDIHTQALPLSYAYDPVQRFAAFQWHAPVPRIAANDSAETASSRLIRVEAFFVCPTSSLPKVGLRVCSLGQDEALSPPTWWTALGLSDKPHDGPVPSFMELAATLAANGSIGTSSADTHEKLVNQAFELDYFRQLSGELAEELRLSQAKVRDLLAREVPKPTEQLAASADSAAGVGMAIDDLSGLPAWAEANKDNITVLNRALSGAKKSIYETPSAVYQALAFLAGPYREFRLGRLPRATFDAQLEESPFKIDGSVGASVAGSQGEDYFVTWNGRRRFLDMHIGKGGGRDERYCLRIYYFWDDDTKKAIVGWLPGHLKNSLS